ncbi:LamG-like jellyroll fold domain-containing protein [Colwellia sp. E150_009]
MNIKLAPAEIKSPFITRSFIALFMFTFCLLISSMNTYATDGEWLTVNDATIEQGNRFYLRGTGYYTDNTIVMDGAEVTEQLRLVVTSSSFAVLNADGVNASGLPYFDLVDPNISTRIIFERARGAFSYTVQLEKFVLPLPPARPSVDTAITLNDYGVHDPSVIKVDDTYYVFGSHLAAAKTTDLMNWQALHEGDNFTNGLLFSPTYADALPEAIDWTGGFVGSWASDVIQLTDGKFYFYYNHCGNPGSGECNMPHSYLGVAVSDNVEGPYVDKGIFLKSGTLSSVTAEDLPDGINSYVDGQMPNAIDPNVFYDKNGGLWMIYGSHFGGIWVLEMDEATAMPKPNQGYGTRLTGGNFYANEGSYMLYSPISDYYYLFTSLGGFNSDGGYNMRISRSRTPNGPFFDADGFNMADVWGDPQEHGVKLMGGFTFVAQAGDEGGSQGYLSPGHNSAYYDEALDKHLLITHTRFPNRSEEHAIRVHEMFINEDDWLVASPHRYVPINGDTNVNTDDLVGNYRFINHEHDTNIAAKTSVYIRLTADGQITGEYTGTYTVSTTEPSNISLQLNSQSGFAGGTFNGVAQWQYNDVLGQLVPTFTALSSDGISVWGSQLPHKSTAELLTVIADSLTIKSSVNTTKISLPTRATRGGTITWQSSHPQVVTSDGTVIRPSVGEADAVVTLTALIDVNGEHVEKVFVVTVKAKRVYNRVAQFNFENNLVDHLGGFADATPVLGTLGNLGGIIAYSAGVNGQAVMLDGTTGVQLPDNLITNYQYTVSFWINPTTINGFTPGFFGAASTSAWLSFLPESWDENTMLWSGQAWFDGSAGERILVDQWTHMAFSVDNGVVKVYLDGVEKFSGGTIADLFSNSPSVFGLGVNYWDLPFNGLIDQLAVYDTNLSLDEIIALDIEQLSNAELLTRVADQINLGNISAVTENITLPNAGDFTAVITWSSSDNTSVNHYGQVTRPEVGEPDSNVTLTATITIGAEQLTRDFELVVKSLDAESSALVAHYSFDNHLVESTANFSDANIIGAMIGTVGGNESYSAGVNGQALYLDGNTGVSLPDGLISNYQYSVAFWVNPTSTSVHTPMFFAANNGDQWLSFLPQNWWDGGTTLWSTNSGAWFNTQTAALTLGQWSHVAFTVDNGLATMYINGVESTSWTGLTDLFTGQDSTFALGVNYWPDLPFNGYIDDFKVFNETLDTAEVANLAIAAE